MTQHAKRRRPTSGAPRGRMIVESILQAVQVCDYAGVQASADNTKNMTQGGTGMAANESQMPRTLLLPIGPPPQLACPRALNAVVPSVNWSDTLQLAELEAMKKASSLVKAYQAENTGTVEQGGKGCAWPSFMETQGPTTK